MTSTAKSTVLITQTWRDEHRHFEALSTYAPDLELITLEIPTGESAELPRRTEAWVDHHFAQIEALDLDPPFRLLGWSFGGVVGLEVARRLREQGRSVAFVGLIDSYLPQRQPNELSDFVWYHLGQAAHLPEVADRLPYLRRRAEFYAYRRFPQLGALTVRALERIGLRQRRAMAAKALKRPNDPLTVAIYTSFLNYQERFVDFPVTLFTTETSRHDTQSLSLRWARWLEAGFDNTLIGGSHFTLFDPEHLASLGAAISAGVTRHGDVQ